MSEFNLVSPLLDGFIMGDPISSHDGVSCCPAIRENSEEKYIVKIISVPATQKQLDALLLTGAYPDAASATDYFKEVAEGIAKDAALLKQLAKLEGFLSYDDWQIVPMEGSRLGYQVYLISPYKRSLEKYLRRHTMTHLGAVNLGLDLCAALSICRRAGYIHMDLKPSNIFLTGKHEFRIGDLGFSKLSALKFTSLPDKYCSCYTPPELHDMMSTLNPTVDIYAVGMILYQIYNNGQLPYEDKAPASILPPPLNADYELAEIILKACDPNPRKRWQTPIEMGQALVSYMQRNSINDIPIVPPAVESDFLDAAYEPAEAPSAPVAAEETPSDNSEATVQPSEELEFLQELVSDETAPDEEDTDILADTSMSDEVSSILAQADELMAEPEAAEPAEETPAEETPAAPEEIPAAEEEAPAAETQPEPSVPDETDEDRLDFDALFHQNETNPSPVEDSSEAEEEDPFLSFEKPRKKNRWLKRIIVIAILALIGFGGFFFYRNYYLVNIDQMVITTEEDNITVELTANADYSILSVVCTDAYGNSTTSSVPDGMAVFTDMAPGTLYKLTVTAEGFHKITGNYMGTVTTVKLAEIQEFTAKTGTEDGSAVLSFLTEDPEQDWVVEYFAEGEEANSVSFTGQTVTINGLTVGSTYTFSLGVAPGTDLLVTGNNTLEFTAARNVVAENLSVVSCVDGVLNAAWNVPDGAAVENWTVRCYSENGYDETITVSETAASFSNISADAAYNVEVTAAGMTQNARTYVSTNPITISNIHVDDSAGDSLVVSWDSNGGIPEGGWLLMYTLDSGDLGVAVKCSENTATIGQIVPGVDYHLAIQSVNGSSVFGGSYTYEGKEVPVFKDHDLDGSKITASLCPTPDKKNWTYEDIASDAYTSTHAVGSKVSIVMYSPDKPDNTNRENTAMFVIRDSEGNVMPELVKTMTSRWREMWKNRSRYCELDLPIIPNTAGQYTLQIFFNGAFVVEKPLNIIE